MSTLYTEDRKADVIDLTRADREQGDLMRRIRAYDPALIVYYDSAVARWGVARQSRGGIHFVMLWQSDPGGEYLPLDARLLGALQRWDLRPEHTLNAARDANVVANLRDARDLANAALREKEFDDAISYQTRQNTQRIIRALEAAR